MADRLRRGALSVLDIATSTMANVGPGYSFYFGFAGIVALSGIATPLTILLAAVAVALLGNTVASFSREMPSTGSFVTFVGRGLGPLAGVAAAMTVIVGYILTIASVVAAMGAISQLLVGDYLHIHLSWKVYAVLFSAIAFALMVKGVKTSTKWAGMFFLVEMTVLLGVSFVLLYRHSSFITIAPFHPMSFAGGVKGLVLGFPLAVYLFVGWENSASLAEETQNPRRDIPRAISFSVFLMAATYLFVSFSSIVGFEHNTKRVAEASIPFISLAKEVAAGVGLIAVLAGFTSTFSVLIAASNSQARLLFNAGREQLLPSLLGRVTRGGQTPYVAFVAFFGCALSIDFLYGWSKDPIAAFTELATLGTLLILIVYFVSNLALPVFMLRHARPRFQLVRHLLLPVLAAALLVYPLYGFTKPGQEAPYSYFPLVALAVLVFAIVYAVVLYRRDPSIGERIGSIIADH
jgi:amino acid transporter